MSRIDLNADLGESFGHWRMGQDAHVLSLVTSANVACGFHAGDPITMRETVTLASDRGVCIGAHPGYPDLLGFGRRPLAASPEEIEAWVLYQVGALAAICRSAGTGVRYVKPHGALYNHAVRDLPAAEAIARAVRAADPTLVLLALPGSAMAAAGAAQGLRVAREAFVDRNYEPNGTLTPRTHPEAVLTDPAVCAERAARLVLDGVVAARDGTLLHITADSLCVHGDGPAAVALLRATRERLTQSGVGIAPFAA